MDPNSAFPDEKEVLLYDGTKFIVESLEKTTKKDGEPLIIVVLKNRGYDGYEGKRV